MSGPAVERVEQEEEDDYTETFQFDVHHCVSRGRNAYSIDTVTEKEGGFLIAFSSEPQGDKNAEAEFNQKQVNHLKAMFEEEGDAKDLEGYVFCTIESVAAHALQELQFYTESEGSRTPPSRDEVTERVCTAFANLSQPDWTGMTGGDKYRYFVSLFDMEVFENDSVAAAWIAHVTARVAQLSDK